MMYDTRITSQFLWEAGKFWVSWFIIAPHVGCQSSVIAMSFDFQLVCACAKIWDFSPVFVVVWPFSILIPLIQNVNETHKGLSDKKISVPERVDKIFF